VRFLKELSKDMPKLSLTPRIWVLFVELLLLLGFSSKLFAAPAPAMASSRMGSLKDSFYTLSQGFKLSIPDQNWQLLNPKAGHSLLDGELQLKSLLQKDRKLTLKMDRTHRPLTLEAYAKRWMRDYSSYGFEILGSKAFQQNQNKALVIDLVHREKQKKIRQIVFLQNQRVIMLTYSDLQTQFEQGLPEFNDIVKSFAWTDLSLAQAKNQTKN
jgi:hypothetical protein